MALYHIETQSLKASKIYYLAKSIRVNDKVLKIRKKIGTARPSPEEESELTTKPNLSLEIKALEKKIRLVETGYDTKYLQPSEINRLERSRHWSYMSTLFLTASEREHISLASEVEYIHGTTAIEGNTFTLQQVDDLLNKKILPSDKTLGEVNEVQNYERVQRYRESYNGKVTIPFIRKLHEIILEKIDADAGRFRRMDSIGIRGVDIAVCPAILIESELGIIIDEYYSNIKAGGHPFEEAVMFHYRFEMIHPFIDGNGRVGREVLNHVLTRARFPRLVITKTDRERYLNALIFGNQEHFGPMLTGFVDILEDNRASVFDEILSGKLS